MADGISIKTNLPDFKKSLAAFGADLERRIVRSGANASAQAFRKAVVDAAPVRKLSEAGADAGRLKRSIYVYRTRARLGMERYSISFRKGRAAQSHKRLGNVDAYYGRFLESGWIPRGRGYGRLKGGARTKALERSRSSAKKITKYRFIAPAFSKAQSAALHAFVSKVESRIKRGK